MRVFFAADEGCRVVDWFTPLNKAFRSLRLKVTRLDVFVSTGAEFAASLLRSDSKGIPSSDSNESSKVAVSSGL